MAQNTAPLERQLLQIDLKKGVNERDRPETANPALTLTRVENLVQDQSGGLVKRPGTPMLGGVATDDAGAAISPVKLLRLRGGLGMIGSAGQFYQYQESTSRFRPRGFMPEFTCKSETIASTGPSDEHIMLSTASSTKFHAITYLTGNDKAVVAIYDRESQALVASYSAPRIPAHAALTPDVGAYAVFVDDRYLHVYFDEDAGTDVSVYVIDTQAALPADESSIVPTVVLAAASIRDITTGDGRSYVLMLNTAATTTYIATTSNAGTVTVSASLADATVTDISWSGSRLWFMGATNLGARDQTTLAASIAAAAHGGTVGRMCADSSNFVHMAYETTIALGGTTVPTVRFRKTTAADSTTFDATVLHVDGWSLQSTPFMATVNGVQKPYVHLIKGYEATTTDPIILPHVVAAMTFSESAVNQDLAAGSTHYSVRPACLIEPMLGTKNSRVLRYNVPQDGLEAVAAVTIQTAVRSYGYSVTTMKSMGHADTACVTFAGENYISGGVHTNYGGGDEPAEVGFVDIPLSNTAEGAAGAMDAGAYKYICVYKAVNESGSVTFSRTSTVSSVTIAASKKVNLVVTPPAITIRDLKKNAAGLASLPGSQIDVYRTKVGGTQYYLVASSGRSGASAPGGLLTQALTMTGRMYTVADNLTDAQLALQPLLFRQPGTANSPIDRYPPPAGNIICQHKDRLFITDPYGVRVYYSSFFVDGETAWFNPAFSFFVHGGSGPITGLVSMDGRLFVFKRDGIFVVDGDGPPEGGPSGNEFSPPQRLATEYGCTDHRSLVITTEGIVYRSDRGLEILTRSLQVKWIGDRVFQTVDANPKVTGAVLDSFGRVHIGLAAEDTGTAQQTETAGVELIYDFPEDCWTISHHTDSDGTYNRCFQDVCRVNLRGLGDVLCYADPSGSVVYSDDSTGLDRETSYIPWVLETCWVKTGLQARQLFSKVQFLAKKAGSSNHAITISIAYDYVDSYTQVGNWQPDLINPLDIEQLEIAMATPEALAIRIKIEEAAPGDLGTYPVGTGLGCAVLGIMSEIAPKTGASKLSVGAKGVALPPVVYSFTGQLGTSISYLGNIMLGDV